MAMRNILIVEDDPIFAMDLTDLVWEAGANPIGPARCLQGALELSSRYPVDLAIVDVNLADGRTGLSLAKLLREQHGIRTIIVSGDVPDPRDVMDTEHTFVQKPVPAEVLSEIMAPRPAARSRPMAAF
jgi:DNA-binding NarL/FixJ family response regulator